MIQLGKIWTILFQFGQVWKGLNLTTTDNIRDSKKAALAQPLGSYQIFCCKMKPFKSNYTNHFRIDAPLGQTCPNWIKPVQIGSNLSKLDQTCPHWIKLVQIGSIMSKLDQTCRIWIKPVRIGSNLSKLDRTCPNWIKLAQIGSEKSKLDQTCQN